MIDGEVGGFVVAHDDHQGEGVLEGKGHGRVEQVQDARSRHLVGSGDGDTILEVDLAGAYLLERLVEDAQLDDRGSLDGKVRIEAYGLVVLQILCEQRDLAGVGCGNGAQLAFK